MPEFVPEVTRSRWPAARAAADQPRQGDVPVDRDDQERGQGVHYYAQVAPLLSPTWPSARGCRCAGRTWRTRCSSRPREPELAATGAHRRRDLPARRRPRRPAPAWTPRLHVPRVDRRQRHRQRDPRPAGHRPRPGQAGGLRECAKVALLLRDRLGHLGLEGLLPGDVGEQGDAVTPLWAVTSRATRCVTSQSTRAGDDQEHPGLVLWKMTKSLRPGKVFLDWSQNVAAKTTISPYSLLRGREGSPAWPHRARGTRSRNCSRSRTASPS